MDEVKIEECKPKFKLKPQFVPLVYLIATAIVAIAGYKVGLPDTLLGTIVAAGLLRVKIPVKPKA